MIVFAQLTDCCLIRMLQKVFDIVVKCWATLFEAFKKFIDIFYLGLCFWRKKFRNRLI